MADNPMYPADSKRLNDALNTLSEHFDSVQIFATRYESGELDGTVNYECGAGNFYARYGQVVAWMNKQNELDRIHTRKKNE